MVSPGKNTKLSSGATKLQNSLNNNIMEKLKKERLNVLRSANKTQTQVRNIDQLNDINIQSPRDNNTQLDVLSADDYQSVV